MAAVAPPAVCPVCNGDQAVGGLPCPGCCCQVCGEPTGGYGIWECGPCFDAEDAAAVRRADR